MVTTDSIAQAVVTGLLEDEELDWEHDPEDPDDSTAMPDTWKTVARRHGFKIEDDIDVHTPFAVRKFYDPLWNTMKVTLVGNGYNNFPEWVKVCLGNEYYNQFYIPMRYLDDFLGRFVKAHIPAVEKAKSMRWKMDAKSLIMLMYEASSAIMASYGLPMTKEI